MPNRAIPYLAGLLALAVAGILITPSICAPRVTPENYEKIREGMQLADVEAIRRINAELDIKNLLPELNGQESN